MQTSTDQWHVVMKFGGAPRAIHKHPVVHISPAPMRPMARMTCPQRKFAMHANALSSSQTSMRAAALPWQHMPLIKSPRKIVPLRLQQLVDPPLRCDEHNAKTASVWVSDDGSLATGVRCLTSRYLTLQGLLLKLKVLAGPHGRLMNRALDLLTGNRLSHVYTCEEDFRRLACEASWAGGNPAVHAAFIDESRDWLVIDAGQAFVDCSAQPSSMLISALANLAELPSPARSFCLDPEETSRVSSHVLGPLMLDTARKLIRSGLGELGITLSEPATRLAKSVGPGALIHWLLNDSPVMGISQ